MMSEPCKRVYSALLDALVEVMEVRSKGGYRTSEADWMDRVEGSLLGFRKELHDEWMEAIQ